MADYLFHSRGRCIPLGTSSIHTRSRMRHRFDRKKGMSNSRSRPWASCTPFRCSSVPQSPCIARRTCSLYILRRTFYMWLLPQHNTLQIWVPLQHTQRSLIDYIGATVLNFFKTNLTCMHGTDKSPVADLYKCSSLARARYKIDFRFPPPPPPPPPGGGGGEEWRYNYIQCRVSFNQ